MLTAMPLVVTTLDDVVADDGQLSLREAIVAANETPGHDVITFKPGLAGTIALNDDQLAITDGLTIRGPKANEIVVDGGGDVRVFAVLPDASGVSPQVAISNLTISNGMAIDAPGYPADSGFAWGGGLYNLAGDVSLSRVQMLGNVATGGVSAGGAIANEFGGTLIVSHSHFADNVSSGLVAATGGAIASDRGPETEGGSVQIRHSSFVDNVAQSVLGQTDFPDAFPYSGAGGGGAIGNFAGSLTVSHSEFVGNEAIAGGQAFGGAISSTGVDLFGIASATLDVRHSTFNGNRATAGVGIRSDATNADGAEAYGGAVSVFLGSDGTLRHNSFQDNLAVGGAGLGDTGNGGNATGGAVAGITNIDLTLARNAFTGNGAVGGAGADEGLNGNGQGGGVGLGVWSVAGGEFDALVPSASMSGDRLVANQADGIGGGVYNAGELTIRRALFGGNEATGGTQSIVYAGSIGTAGGAMGGGVANFGSLAISQSQFRGNVVRGADEVDSTMAVYGGTGFAGAAFGGGLSNHGHATVENSRFERNVSEAGDGGNGDFATIGSGGAIYSDEFLEVSRSRFTRNEAFGGDNGQSPFHNGHALGGAIASGSLLPLFDPESAGAELVVDHSQFSGNRAVGGDGNQVTNPEVARADGPNNAFGGAILVYQGTASIGHTVVVNNLAQGGDGGAEDNGSLGVGGGIFLFSFVGGVTAELEHLFVWGNEARGGIDGAGIGGGIAIGSFDSPFGAPGTAKISHSSIVNNRAVGGAGDGDAFGGGIFNGDSDTLLIRDGIFANTAVGDEGQGGGVYNESGELKMDRLTRLLTRFNHASDDGDNFYGDISLLF